MYDVPAMLDDPLLRGPLLQSLDGEQTPAFLRSVKFKLTARCNLRCVMCRYGKGLKLPELPTERVLGILDELAELGTRKVHFSGGEVLARSDFEQLVARSAERQLKVTLTSNLTLLTKARAKALMRYKISSVSTSLDGASRKVHERVRGIPGSFARTCRALGYLARERERRGQRTRLRVNMTLMRDNVADYPALIRLAAELGATAVVPMPVDSRNKQLRLNKQGIRHYNEVIAPAVLQARMEVGMDTAEALVYPFGRGGEQLRESAEGNYAGGYYRDHVCYAPWLHMFVAWDGKVYLCCMTNGRIAPLGDLATDSVRAVFWGPAFAAAREQMRSERLAACHQCDMYLAENQLLASVGHRGPGAEGLRRGDSGGASRRLPVVSG